MPCGAVIPAAGRADRLGNVDKTLLELAGKPALAWILDVFAASGEVSEIAIAVSERNRDDVIDLTRAAGIPLPFRVVLGGETRRDSVQAGVRALSDTCDLILIHDAARPLVSTELISATISAAVEHGSAIAAVPLSDTIKEVGDGSVIRTVDRSQLVAVQTPQVFRRQWLVDAYLKAGEHLEATDESMILEAAGYPVRVVPGNPSNIKLTTMADVAIANALFQMAGRAE